MRKLWELLKNQNLFFDNEDYDSDVIFFRCHGDQIFGWFCSIFKGVFLAKTNNKFEFLVKNQKETVYDVKFDLFLTKISPKMGIGQKMGFKLKLKKFI